MGSSGRYAFVAVAATLVLSLAAIVPSATGAAKNDGVIAVTKGTEVFDINGGAVATFRFAPEVITIASGTKVTWKHLDTSRGKLDRQRNAVELPGDRSDQRKIFSVRREVVVQGLCPGDQQLRGAACEDVLALLSALRGDVERRNAIDILAVDTKHLAARRQNYRMWTGTYERLCQPRRPFNEMLAIIQHEQEFSCSDFARNGFDRNLAALLQAENSRHRKRHQFRVR